MNVLLAEDDVLIALDMQMVLEDAGHRVLGPVASVKDGEAAIKNAAPDVAIVDIGLKDGDSGIDLAVILQARGVPVVYVSGEPSRAYEGRKAAIGYLPKPVMPQDLAGAIAVADAIARGGPVPQAPNLFEVFAGDTPAAGPVGR